MDNSTLYERIMRSLPEATDDECWFVPYKGAKGGYPQITIAKDDGSDTMRTMSRLVWEMHNAEPIPDGLQVLHSCDNPRCVNPHHLFVGTHQDNMTDKARRKRSRTGYHPPRRKYECIYRRTDGGNKRPKYVVQRAGFPKRTFRRLADAVRYRDSLPPKPR